MKKYAPKRESPYRLTIKSSKGSVVIGCRSWLDALEKGRTAASNRDVYSVEAKCYDEVERVVKHEVLK